FAVAAPAPGPGFDPRPGFDPGLAPGSGAGPGWAPGAATRPVRPGPAPAPPRPSWEAPWDRPEGGEPEVEPWF
ncbi:MAG TPA: hypothetical protein VGO78_21075, partial [Acidimicrobiales bacterium]|nr:hypothetical protein [Acidimicrobiales bacterium]